MEERKGRGIRKREKGGSDGKEGRGGGKREEGGEDGRG